MSEVIDVEIASIFPHPDNSRHGDVPAIMRSLERFGQVKPVVVQKSTRFVVAGNHTVRAAKQLGWTTVKAIVMDMDEQSARAYLIADNRTADKATYNRGKLYDLLDGVLDLTGIGFTDEEIEELAGDVSEEAAYNAYDPNAGPRVQSSRDYDPLRQIILAVPVSEIDAFTRQMAALQEHWQQRTTVDMIKHLVRIAFEALPKPEEAFVKKVGSDF